MKISRHEFLHRVGINGETLDVWVEEEWLFVAEAEDGPTFTEVDVARARFIRDLISDIGVNHEGVGVVLHLLDQIHDLRRILRRGEGSGRGERLGSDD